MKDRKYANYGFPPAAKDKEAVKFVKIDTIFEDVVRSMEIKKGVLNKKSTFDDIVHSMEVKKGVVNKDKKSLPIL